MSDSRPITRPAVSIPAQAQAHFRQELFKTANTPPRTIRTHSLRFCIALFLLITNGIVFAQDKQTTVKQIRHFETKIRPVLISRCLKCHGEKKQEGQLRLDSQSAILKGGENGPIINVDQPDESSLLQALRYESFEMPPDGQLAEKTISHFEVWIRNGAVWPQETQLRAAPTSITPRDRQWWAFRPVQNPQPPHTNNSNWPGNAIDQFVLATQEKHNLEPAPPASRSALLRRLYFNTIGIPPTPTELHQFLGDTSPDAYERTVDALLSNPHYGEHQARHWLDLVRYSDSDGWNQDAFRPQIWRYRDYVIDAMNSDKPWPDFVREQLAGDEMPDRDPTRWAAAGFLRLGIYEYNQRDARGHWNDIINEMTDVTGDVFFGLSMACARCHDHKFDPILQADYFRLRAFFEPIEWRDDLKAATQKQYAQHAASLKKWEEATADIRAKIDKLLKPYHDKKWTSTVAKFPLDIQSCFHKPVNKRNSWEHQMAYLVSRQFEEEAGGPLKSMSKADKAKHAELKKQLAVFDKLKPAPLPDVMTVTDFSGAPAQTKIPGDTSGRVIAPGFPVVLDNSPANKIQPTTFALTTSLPQKSAKHTSTGRRTALAKWIGQPDNPLTNRVAVNRIWQQQFGRGLVNTPSDFGRNGQQPTHPQLLDWLTHEFITHNFSRKHIHKLILMSATWQQASRHPRGDEFQQIDKTESLLWRAPIRRLTAEQIRDAMLVGTTELSREIGGRSVDEKTPRRAIYVKSFRNKLNTFLHAFDMSPGLKSVPERTPTTTPTQALLLINGDYTLARAKRFAVSLEKHGDAAAQIRQAILIVWGREPTADELSAAVEFVTVDDKVDRRRLVDFCHVLFNSNEFLYID